MISKLQTSYQELRLILGDQLNIQHHWYKEVDPSVLYVMMEVKSETDYVVHHIQKVASIFKAMELFAEKLTQQGHQVKYIYLDDPDNTQSFVDNVRHLIQKYSIHKIQYQAPDEYRLDEILDQLKDLGVECLKVNTDHFYTKRSELKDFFKDKKIYLMESFYRHMRLKHAILLEKDNKPIGGKWNFDKENRKPIHSKVKIPPPASYAQDVSKPLERIRKMGIRTMGNITHNTVEWPLTKEESLQSLDYFIEYLLSDFGNYQDAMHTEYAFLFHSKLSFSLNVKLISPSEVINQVIQAFHQYPSKYSIATVEGFVRQILGWREYMRGMYWALMPQFAQENYFEHQRTIPDFLWTGDTKMNCVKYSVQQSLDLAYAHHIQRLMVIGNFLLLAGIHPDEVDRWYLGVYIDAFEWVEITNTRGMSQFADGGKIATKPYISSASYINKMSNYCGSCFYNKDKKVGERACPFNSLYWNFFHTHQNKLSKNPRIGMMYATWNKMKPTEKEALIQQAQTYLSDIENL